jgi:DeoR family deoxyribose operon repressor
MDERLLDIIKGLETNGIMSIKQLAEKLNVSEMTIRRDIARLEKQNQVNVFYGGVMLNKNRDKHHLENDNNGSDKEAYLFEIELSRQTEEKTRIAQKAATLIEPSDVLMIDVGSTCSLLVDCINDDSEHIVYTYSMNVLNKSVQRKNMRTVLCGGYFHGSTGMFESAEGAAQLKKAYINKAFFGARGITDTVGITTEHPYEVLMKKTAMESSQQKILLVDSTKIGKVWYSKYAELSEMDIIITDDKVSPDHVKMIENSGIKLYIV